MNQKIDESRCPLCGGENHCGAGSGDCWCRYAKIPMELREKVPPELKNKVCICKSCVDSHHG